MYLTEATLTTFNYADFKQRWLEDCIRLVPVDPDWLSTRYADALIKADFETHIKRQRAGWWTEAIHGPARIEGDPADDRSNFNIDDPTIDPDQVDIPTFRELWLEVTKEIRKDVSPRNYERWQLIASEIGEDLKPERLRGDLVPMV